MWKIYDQDHSYILENETKKFIFSGQRKNTNLCIFLQNCQDDPDLWNAFEDYEKHWEKSTVG